MAGKASIIIVFAIFITATTAWAFGGGGGGGPGGISSPVDLLMPGPPRNVQATAGNGMATVSFDAPKSDGGSPITDYTVTSHPGGLSAKGDGSPLTVKGLTNGKTYTFTVSASNSVGTGLDSDPSNEVTLK